jgi:hypothetical protein
MRLLDGGTVAHVYCAVCGADFHSDVRTCPSCGAHDKQVHERRRGSRPSLHLGGEDVEQEVRDTLYGRRSGTVERLAQT